MGRHLSVGHPLLPGHQPDHHVREIHLRLQARERQARLRSRHQGPLPAGASNTHLGEHGIEAVQPALCSGHHVPGGRLLGLLGQFLQKEAAELPPVLVQVGGFGLTGHAGQRLPVARTGGAGAGLRPISPAHHPPSLSVLPGPESLPYWLTQLTGPLRPSWPEQLVNLVDRPADKVQAWRVVGSPACPPQEARSLWVWPWVLIPPAPVLPAPTVCQARAQDLLVDRGVSCERGANQTQGGGDLSGLQAQERPYKGSSCGKE